MSTLNKDETIKRLCALCTFVAINLDLASSAPHDCFCEEGLPNPVMDKRIIAFIEEAVRETCK